ncbi:MAG TPA: M48 family metallopeptidase [Opitutaceae bacterium]|jgi:STE24 endopeptidase
MIGPLFYIACGLVLARLAAACALSALNRRHVVRCRANPPPAVVALEDEATRAKSAEYTLVHSRFGDLTDIFDAGLVLVVLGCGVLPWAYGAVSRWGTPGSVWTGAAFVFLTMTAFSACSLPWDAWDQFSLEERFGFNRTTPGRWLLDKVKGFVLALILGFPVLWALLALVRRAGPSWWLWAAGLVFALQVIMLVIYPHVILPWFNKLSPLPDGELRSRLLALGQRTGFRAGAIDVIDGSKRSNHSNAYFTGFGRFRRVVLYDTLIAQLSAAELEAVLAHEIGHYRLRHIPQRIGFSVVMLVLGFGALAWLARAPWFTADFGFPPQAEAPAFLLFVMLSGTVSFWLTPLSAAWSRHHEYQADRFAREAMGDAGPMVGALRRLSETNLSNLTPHPLYSAFHYSHPTLVERESALVGGARGPHAL